MASVASQLIEEFTAHAQSDSLEDAREICADGTYFPNNLRIYRGTDKSLAPPGRKQARKQVRDARDINNMETRAVIKFLFFSCKARRRRKFTPF